jgi:S1-C subfamily serine protease
MLGKKREKEKGEKKVSNLRRKGGLVTLVFLCLVLISGLVYYCGPRVINSVVNWGVERVVDDVIDTVVLVEWSGMINGREAKASGSGVIINPNGLILTAAHVVNRPGTFTVTTSDGKKYVTTKACVSKGHDVGYLKIDVANLPVAKFGNSDEVKLGSRLVAIGSPWGEMNYNSVTLGHLSAKKRSIEGPFAPSGWGVLFQTDVAANPGNSGGPVFNTKGEVVGVVVGLLSVRMRGVPPGYDGITYCVPSNVAKSILTSVWLQLALQEVEVVGIDSRLSALERKVNELNASMIHHENRIDYIANALAETIEVIDALEETMSKEEEEHSYTSKDESY